MIQEAINSIKLQIHDRVSSPFFSAFTAASIFVNHKFFMVLFSNETVTIKFELIANLYPNNIDYIFGFIRDPAVSAIIFLTLYPIPSAGIYWIWVRYQRFLQNQKQKLFKERLISRE